MENKVIVGQPEFVNVKEKGAEEEFVSLAIPEAENILDRIQMRIVPITEK